MDLKMKERIKKVFRSVKNWFIINHPLFKFVAKVVWAAGFCLFISLMTVNEVANLIQRMAGTTNINSFAYAVILFAWFGNGELTKFSMQYINALTNKEDKDE
jgi:hypothetical protein